MPRLGSRLQASAITVPSTRARTCAGAAEDNAIYLTSPVMVYARLLDREWLAGGIYTCPRPAMSAPSTPASASWSDLPHHPASRRGSGAETRLGNAHLTQGGANAWSVALHDVERGTVLVITGSRAVVLIIFMAPTVRAITCQLTPPSRCTPQYRAKTHLTVVRRSITISGIRDLTSPPILDDGDAGDGRRIDAAVANNAAELYLCL